MSWKRPNDLVCEMRWWSWTALSCLAALVSRNHWLLHLPHLVGVSISMLCLKVPGFVTKNLAGNSPEVFSHKHSYVPKVAKGPGSLVDWRGLERVLLPPNKKVSSSTSNLDRIWCKLYKWFTGYSWKLHRSHPCLAEMYSASVSFCQPGWPVVIQKKVVAVRLSDKRQMCDRCC